MGPGEQELSTAGLLDIHQAVHRIDVRILVDRSLHAHRIVAVVVVGIHRTLGFAFRNLPVVDNHHRRLFKKRRIRSNQNHIDTFFQICDTYIELHLQRYLQHMGGSVQSR